MRSIATLLLSAVAFTQDGAKVPPATQVSVNSVVAADAAPIVVALDGSGGLHFLDAHSGGRVEDLPGNVRVEGANWVDIDPTGERVVTLDLGGRVQLWSPRVQSGPAEVAKITPSEAMEKGTWTCGAFLRFSPSGERIVVGVHGGQVLLLDGKGASIGETPEILGQGERLGGIWFDAPLAWSGDGGRLGALTTGGPVLFDAISARRVNVMFDTNGIELRSIALDGKGERLAVGGAALTLGSFSTADGSRAWWDQLSMEGTSTGAFGLAKKMSVAGLAFSPDGEHLACTTAESSHAAIVSASTGKKAWLGEFHGGRMGEPRELLWSPSSHRLYHTFASGGSPLVRTDCERNEAGRTTYREVSGEAACLPESGFEGLGVTTDGKFVIGLDLDSGEERWRVEL